jgi:hypothetical protein
MQPHSTKKLKQTKNFFQNTDGNCFLGEERSADGGIHAARDHNVIHVLQNTQKKTANGHLKQKAWNADIQNSTPPW